MSIIQHERPVSQPAPTTDLHREVVVRQARAALSDARTLLNGPGPFMQDPQAPAVFGRMTQSLDALLWLLTGGAL